MDAVSVHGVNGGALWALKGQAGVLDDVFSGSAGTAPRVHVTGGGADEAGGEGKRYE
jgi:hypothetical protein